MNPLPISGQPAAPGTIRIAAIQMISGPEVEENLQQAERLIAEAAAIGAQLVALPEYFPLIAADE